MGITTFEKVYVQSLTNASITEDQYQLISVRTHLHTLFLETSSWASSQ